MSDFSPLIPQGSLLEQQAKGRPHLRIALCIVAGHLVFLGGLLMQGCKREEPGDVADGSTLPTLDLSDRLPPLVVEAPPLPPQEEPTTSSVAEPIPGTGTPTVPPQWPVPQEQPPEWDEVVVAPPPVVPVTPEPSRVTGAREHTVVRGDTFYGLAQRYKVTSADIARANPGVNAESLQIGRKLTIPAPSAEPVVRGPGATEGVHVVKRGENLTRIAGQYGTTVEALKKLNGLVTDQILVDQKLLVPARPGGTTPGN